MDSDNLLFTALAGSFCTLVLSIAAYNMHANYLAAQVMKTAANPVALNCSFNGKEASNTPFCMEAAKSLNK